MVLCVWLGVVVTEALFEFSGSDAESLRAAARFHYTVDKYGELPILLGVVVTGLILTVRAWPLTSLHWIKIAASLVAVGVGDAAAAGPGREPAAGIPAADLEHGGGRRGVRDGRSLPRAGPFPRLRTHSRVAKTLAGYAVTACLSHPSVRRHATWAAGLTDGAAPAPCRGLLRGAGQLWPFASPATWP